MPKVIVSLAGTVVGEFALPVDRCGIGRKPDNDIGALSRMVSQYHSQAAENLNHGVLDDLASINRILVNEQPITRNGLHDGDLITIGRYKLRYVCD
jgi:pSer/pThr/pTyr-binding forkhead associated (FHA) protein